MAATIRLTLLSSVLVLALGASRAACDIVYTHDGQQYEGEVIEAGDTIIIKMKYGMTRKVRRSNVARIEKKMSAREEYQDKLSALKIRERTTITRAISDASSADVGAVNGRKTGSKKTVAEVKKDLAQEHYKLGMWCKKTGLGKAKKERFERAIELDSGHAAAHTALGHVKYLGRWVPLAEKMKAEGYVLYKYKWRKPEEVAKLKSVRSKTMRERMREVNKTDPKNSMNRKCPKCNATGIRVTKDCGQCNGSGELNMMSGLAICRKCGGTGKKYLRCPWCGGDGIITRFR